MIDSAQGAPRSRRVFLGLLLLTACPEKRPAAPVEETAPEFEVARAPAGIYQLHQAWWFHGGSTIEAASGARLVALRITGPSSTVRISLFDGESLLDSALQRVSVDESGAPLNRFDTSMIEAQPEHFVIIGAVPQSLGRVRVVVGEPHAPRLDQTLEITEGGATWPPNPENLVLKLSRVGPRTLRLLVKSRHHLPHELPGPALRRKLDGAQEIHSGRPEAAAIATRSGMLVAAGALPTAQWRYLVLDYQWPGEESEPNEYGCAQGWCALPAPSPWPEDPRLSEALKKARAFSPGDLARLASGLPPHDTR